MEQHVLGNADFDNLITSFSFTTSTPRLPCPLQSLASLRALIINPSTSDKIISLVFESLARFLQRDREINLIQLHYHVLKLLSDLALRHRHFSHVVFDTVHSYVFSQDPNLSVLSLSVLLTIAESDESFFSAIKELNEDYLLSLCLSPSITTRSWILLNTLKFQVRPSLLVAVFLRFTNDPHPYMRRIALDGLVTLSKSSGIESCGLVGECYDRAVDLLLDSNDYVRSAAIHVVTEWYQKVTVSDTDVADGDWFDSAFVQLCSMVRDMSMEVRNEAFLALGKIKLVSEDILLQTLSKKVLGIIKERKLPRKCATKQLDLLASNAAGAFVHGLEDEFFEVRRSACKSLGILVAFSVQFAHDALNLLMDMLNDDSMVVRLQILDTMYQMVKSNRLKVQEIHMHMFLGTLVDVSTLIRIEARNVLRYVKLTNMDIFKSSIDGLLSNLETYPEDEADIFSVLFHMGRNHAKFASSFIKEVSQEIEPSCEGELSLDNARVTAILVLAISATLTRERHLCTVPEKVFPYAVPFLGRISHSLGDVVTQDTLLAYLSQSSRIMHFPDADTQEDHLFLPGSGRKLPIHNIDEIIDQVEPLQQISNQTSEMLSQDNMWDLRQTISALVCQQRVTSMHEEAERNVNFILGVVVETWQSIKLGFLDEVRMTLRSCKEELQTIAVDSRGPTGLLAFASQYIRVVKLLAKTWIHVMPLKRIDSYRTGMLDLLLEKLDTSLRKLMHGYSGFSKKEELHILELILLTCVLRLPMVEICCQNKTLKRSRSTLSRMELICEAESIKPSAFAEELKKVFSETGYQDAFSYSVPSKKLLEVFALEQAAFSGRLKQIKGELDIPSNDSENPLPFISGLPAGITFHMKLLNISNEDKLWIKMSVEDMCQYVYLDRNQIGEQDEIKNVMLNVPFYRTPKAASFSLRACIGKECPSEDVSRLVKGCGGPKGDLIFISNEKEVFMAATKMNQNR